MFMYAKTVLVYLLTFTHVVDVRLVKTHLDSFLVRYLLQSRSMQGWICEGVLSSEHLNRRLLNVLTEGAITTFSGRLFHWFTTLLEKLFALILRRGLSLYNFWDVLL